MYTVTENFFKLKNPEELIQCFLVLFSFIFIFFTVFFKEFVSEEFFLA